MLMDAVSVTLLCGALVALAAGGSAAVEGPVTMALKPFIESKALAGAVTLVADKDRVLDEECVGFADRAAGKPMKPDSLFWIASMSKPITAAALMMLVDEGKLTLDDPVEKYLPEFRGQWLAVEKDADHELLKHPKQVPTIRNILSHTAGFPFSSALEQPTLDTLPLKVAVRSYAAAPLRYEPGTRYEYSNAGVNTAGRIIEVLSGMPYEQFMQKRIFDPLGMKDTSFWPTKAQQNRLVKAYAPNADKTDLVATQISQLRYPLEDPTRGPMPAGGLFSTAEDCLHFCRMLLNGGVYEGKRLLSENAVSQMSRKQTGDAVDAGYGLGCGVGDGWFDHGGACGTNMRIDTKHRIITIYLIQHTGYLGNGGDAHGAFLNAAAVFYTPAAAR